MFSTGNGNLGLDRGRQEMAVTQELESLENKMQAFCLSVCPQSPKCQCQLQLHWGNVAFRVGDGNGNPLQYSCLENPEDRGAWWAAVHGVAKSQTLLKQLSSSSNHLQSKGRCTHAPLYSAEPAQPDSFSLLWVPPVTF